MLTLAKPSETTLIPESIATAQAVIAGEPVAPPGTLTKFGSEEGWEWLACFRDDARDTDIEWNIHILDLPFAQSERLMAEVQRGENPLLRLRMIERAMDEIFRILSDFDKAGGGFDTLNVRLSRRYKVAVIAEMEALLAEWLEITGGQDL